MTAAQRAIVCPPWCVVDHADDKPGDAFHHSAHASIVPPAEAGTTELAGAFVELLHAVLVVGDDPEVPPVILLDFMGHATNGVDLDLAGTDEMLAEVDRYRARLQDLRDRLAEASRG